MHQAPAEAVGELIHTDTQVHDGAVDLTVASVHVLDEPAHIDFGGSEVQLPATTVLEPERRHPDDEYGWWSLEAGTYLLRYNETLLEPPALLHPRELLIRAGAGHPTGWVTELGPVGLTVGGGLELKENARVSTLWPVEPTA